MKEQIIEYEKEETAETGRVYGKRRVDTTSEVPIEKQ